MPIESALFVADKVKPCVSHRDLNSRNILVKSDLSCCLCDLGFAMKISGSRYYQNGEEQVAETKSINDVSCHSKVPQYHLVKNVKRMKEFDTYLTHVCRNHCGENPVKR